MTGDKPEYDDNRNRYPNQPEQPGSHCFLRLCLTKTRLAPFCSINGEDNATDANLFVASNLPGTCEIRFATVAYSAFFGVGFAVALTQRHLTTEWPAVEGSLWVESGRSWMRIDNPFPDPQSRSETVFTRKDVISASGCTHRNHRLRTTTQAPLQSIEVPFCDLPASFQFVDKRPNDDSA